MKSIMVNANERYSEELEKFVLNPELLNLISGGTTKCKYCSELCTIVDGGGHEYNVVDCVTC